MIRRPAACWKYRPPSRAYSFTPAIFWIGTVKGKDGQVYATAERFAWRRSTFRIRRTIQNFPFNRIEAGTAIPHHHYLQVHVQVMRAAGQRLRRREQEASGETARLRKVKSSPTGRGNARGW